MKKYLIAFMLLGVLTFGGVSQAKAVTFDDLWNEIASLKVQVANLTTQLSAAALRANTSAQMQASPAQQYQMQAQPAASTDASLKAASAGSTTPNTQLQASGATTSGPVSYTDLGNGRCIDDNGYAGVVQHTSDGSMYYCKKALQATVDNSLSAQLTATPSSAQPNAFITDLGNGRCLDKDGNKGVLQHTSDGSSYTCQIALQATTPNMISGDVAPTSADADSSTDINANDKVIVGGNGQLIYAGPSTYDPAGLNIAKCIANRFNPTYRFFHAICNGLLLGAGAISTAPSANITGSVASVSSTQTVSFSHAPVYGEKSDTVKTLQNLLVAKGYLTADNATGLYGKSTTAAVKQFQLDNGISSDGTSFGKQSQAALQAYVPLGGSSNPSAFAPGCTSSIGFSRTTGLPCGIPTTGNSGTKLDSSCGARSTPSITVVSPNGGETYAPGQKITVTWTSCNVPAGNIIALNVIAPPLSSNSIGFGLTNNLSSYIFANDGSETVTLPNPANISGWHNGLYFKVRVLATINNTTLLTDDSDNLFTISVPASQGGNGGSSVSPGTGSNSGSTNSSMSGGGSQTSPSSGNSVNNLGNIFYSPGQKWTSPVGGAGPDQNIGYHGNLGYSCYQWLDGAGLSFSNTLVTGSYTTASQGPTALPSASMSGGTGVCAYKHTQSVSGTLDGNSGTPTLGSSCQIHGSKYVNPLAFPVQNCSAQATINGASGGTVSFTTSVLE